MECVDICMLAHYDLSPSLSPLPPLLSLSPLSLFPPFSSLPLSVYRGVIGAIFYAEVSLNRNINSFINNGGSIVADVQEVSLTVSTTCHVMCHVMYCITG